MDPRDFVQDPSSLIGNLMFAALLTLVLLAPAQLFNTTLEENYDEVRALLRLPPARERTQREGFSTNWLGFAALSVVTGVLYALLSPDVGIDVASLALVAGIAASIILVTLVAEAVSGAWVARRAGARGYLRLFPGALAVGIACVALSRAVGFEPGYLYGIVAAAAFTGAVPKEIEARGIVVTCLGSLIVGVAAWAALVPVRAMTEGPAASFGAIMLEVLLVATFVGAIEGVLFSLLPLGFLDGHKLVTWSRAIWAIVFGLALFLFVHVLLNPTSGYIGVSDQLPVTLVIALFVGFSLFSIAFWLFFRVRSARTA